MEQSSGVKPFQVDFDDIVYRFQILFSLCLCVCLVTLLPGAGLELSLRP